MSFFSTSSMVSVENAMKLTVSDSLIHCRMASVSSGLNLKLVWFFFPTSEPFGGKYPQHCSNAPKERCRSNMIQFLFPETVSERSGCLADIDDAILTDLPILCRYADTFTELDAIQPRHIRNHFTRQSADGNKLSLQQFFLCTVEG